MEGQLLSGLVARLEDAQLLRGAIERRRAQRQLLPHAAGDDLAELGVRGAAGIQVLHEGKSRAHVLGRSVRQSRPRAALQSAHRVTGRAIGTGAAAVPTDPPEEPHASRLAARGARETRGGGVPTHIMVRWRHLPRAARTRRGAGGHRRGEVAEGAAGRRQLDGLLPAAARLRRRFLPFLDRRGALGGGFTRIGAGLLSA
jgi:hypothetical protein